jgi:hypothetical protein
VSRPRPRGGPAKAPVLAASPRRGGRARGISSGTSSQFDDALSVNRSLPAETTSTATHGGRPRADAGLPSGSSQRTNTERPDGLVARSRIARTERESARPRHGHSQLVPSGREVRTDGDARIRGKEKPAGSRASCRPLLRFVHCDSADRVARRYRSCLNAIADAETIRSPSCRSWSSAAHPRPGYDPSGSRE